MQGAAIVARQPGSSRASRLACCAILAIGLAFHLPRLFRPLSDVDACAGSFFGVFFHYYDRFGFAELRGMPLWPVLFPLPQLGWPYLTHPPGLWWSMYALGGEEWAMRAPSIAGALLAALMCFLLVRTRFGVWPAFAAAVALLGAPAMAVYCQASYEPVSTGLGLTMWWACLRAIERRAMGRPVASSHALAAGCAFVGTWMDWSFGMFCFGLVPLLATRSFATTARRLAVPGIATLLAVVSVLVWQKWALASPLVTPPEAGSSWETIQRTILDRPPLGRYLERIGHWCYHSMGPALCVALPIGAGLAFWRAPRLAAATALAGASHFLLFAEHALVHPHFYCLSTPFFVLAVAAIGGLARGRLRVPMLIVVAGVVVATWWAGIDLDRRTDSTFQRDLGRTLCEAAIEAEPGAEELKVGTNFFPVFAHYVDDPDVYPVPIVDPAYLESVRRDRHVRYLWMVVDKPANKPHNDRLPELEAYLAPFAKRRIPELEYHFRDAGYEYDYDIVEAWLVDLPRAR